MKLDNTSLPQRTKSIYARLCNEFCHTLLVWRLYRQLFGTNAARIKLMNDRAPESFGTIQSSIFQSVVLMICRLTDKPTVATHETCTLKQFVRSLDPVEHKELIGVLSRRLTGIKKSAKLIRYYRNNYLAHINLDNALQKKSARLESRHRVGVILKRIAYFLNQVEKHFGLNITSYTYMLILDDAPMVIESLLKADALDRLMIEGKIASDYFLSGPFKDAYLENDKRRFL